MSNFKTKVKGFITGAMLVPAAGLLAHMGMYAGESSLGDDYSLKHRFECAYSLTTPKEHTEYTITPYYGGYFGEPEKTPYMASPWLTYPAMLALGLIGARKEWDYNRAIQKAIGKSR